MVSCFNRFNVVCSYSDVKNKIDGLTVQLRQCRFWHQCLDVFVAISLDWLNDLHNLYLLIFSIKHLLLKKKKNIITFHSEKNMCVKDTHANACKIVYPHTQVHVNTQYMHKMCHWLFYGSYSWGQSIVRGRRLAATQTTCMWVSITLALQRKRLCLLRFTEYRKQQYNKRGRQ